MKKLFLLVLVLPLLSQAQPAKDETAIKSLLMETFDSIWSAARTDKLSQYHTDDYLLMEDGEVWNNDSIRIKLQPFQHFLDTTRMQGHRFLRKNHFEYERVEIKDDVAWIVYQNYANIFYDDKQVRKSHWLESAVFVKTKNGWRIKLLHSTYINPPGEKKN